MVEQDVLRGVNLVGMEGGYGEDNAGTTWDRAVGPRADKDYPVHSPELIDYFRSKNVAVIRLLFSWERVQSELFGPVPAVGAGYAAYCENLTQVVTYATSLGITVIVEPWQADAEGGAGGARWRGELVGSAASTSPRSPISGQSSPRCSGTTVWWSTDSSTNPTGCPR